MGLMQIYIYICAYIYIYMCIYLIYVFDIHIINIQREQDRRRKSNKCGQQQQTIFVASISADQPPEGPAAGAVAGLIAIQQQSIYSRLTSNSNGV